MFIKTDNLSQIKKQFSEYFSNPDFEIEIIQTEDHIKFNSLDHVLVSGIAVWSGHTQMFGKTILNKLQEVGPNPLKVLFVDIDHTSEELQLELWRTRNHGYFESAWFVNGQKVAQYKYQNELEPFVQQVSETIVKNNT